MGLWTKAQEHFHGRSYVYLISGEAFDWLLLVERLCEAIGNPVPEDEKTALLFRGVPPLNLSAEEFQALIGDAKYRQYLNYFYGVTVEEALVLAVEDEVRKEKHASGRFREHEVTNEAFRRIYGGTLATALRHFRREESRPETGSISLTELKEFAYWRFRYRLKACEKAKVASDTRKGLNWLMAHGVTSYMPTRDPAQESGDSEIDGKGQSGNRHQAQERLSPAGRSLLLLHHCQPPSRLSRSRYT